MTESNINNFREADNNFNLGLQMLDQGLIEKAEEYFRLSVNYIQDNFEVWLNFGIALIELGKFSEAENALIKTIELNSSCSEAFYYLGNLYGDKKETEKAIFFYEQSILRNPDIPETYYNLANLQVEHKNYHEAELNYKKSLFLYPEFTNALLNLANVQVEQNKNEEAILNYNQLLTMAPDMYDTYLMMAKCLHKEYKTREALLLLKKYLYHVPDSGEGWYTFGNMLSSAGMPDEAIQYTEKALKLNPEIVYAYSNIIFFLQDSNNFSDEKRKEAFNKFNNYCKKFPRFLNHMNSIEQDRKLKIGYISPDFKSHSCSVFIESLLSEHSHENFKIYCFSNTNETDYISQRLLDYTDNWYNVRLMTDDELSRLIYFEQIDILVDLALHTGENRLAMMSRKPAPVQVSWLGFPAGTGLETIDYKLSDPWLTSENTQEYFSEKIWNLDIPSHCYTPWIDLPVEKPPCLNHGYITFGSFNNFRKLNNETFLLWAKIMNVIPGSRLLIKVGRVFENNPDLRVKVLKIFSDNGVDNTRILFIEFINDYEQHMKLYNQVDILLDSFPYNGCTTTFDSLWMGVPVLSLTGERACSRYGLSILSAIGLEEFSCKIEDEIVNKAVELAGNFEKLEHLRLEIKERFKKSSLYDKKLFTQKVEDAYRKMWRKWCIMDF